MVHNSWLIHKLNEISKVTEENFRNSANVGIVAGISGIALFHFYYSKYLDIEKHSEIGAEMISFCFEKINEGYSNPSYCNGIAGLGWAIQHLTTNAFIDVDCDNLLSQFDGYLYSQMTYDFNQSNYDFLHGALGYAFYFLSRYEQAEITHLKKRYESYLSEVLNQLEKLAIEGKKGIKWRSVLDVEKGNEGYNLSLSHGISSIINFLTRLHDIDKFSEASKKLLIGGAKYILSLENATSENLSLFPSWVEEGFPREYNSRIAWCYGDLGIGLSLLHAGKSLNDDSLTGRAVEILHHTAKRKLPHETQVQDAGVCHGSYGNAHIYQRVLRETSQQSFAQPVDFWMEDGIKKAVFDDGYAGYKQWNGLEKDWKPELSLLEGVAGIGLTIIDYLSEIPNDWDECLMIS